MITTHDFERKMILDAERWGILAVLGMGLDGVTTWWALNYVPGATEANPIVAAAIGSIGITTAMCLKVLLGGTLAIALTHLAAAGYPTWLSWARRDWRFRTMTPKQAQRAAYRRLRFVAVLMTVVVIWNAITIIRYT